MSNFNKLFIFFQIHLLVFTRNGKIELIKHTIFCIKISLYKGESIWQKKLLQ